jgi:hypothetical protein
VRADETRAAGDETSHGMAILVAELMVPAAVVDALDIRQTSKEILSKRCTKSRSLPLLSTFALRGA